MSLMDMIMIDRFYEIPIETNSFTQQTIQVTGYRLSYLQQMTKKNQQDNEIFMVNGQSQSTQCPG